MVSEFEGNFEFPFAIVESVEGIFVSDTGKHCVYQIDAHNNSVTPAIGLHERSGEDDGPLNTAKLRSPTGLASRGSRIYIGEHPDEIQGAIRVCFSLERLIKYQSVWNEISTTMSLVSKRLSVAEPDHAKHVKGAIVSETLPELKQSAAKLEQLIESNKDRLNVQALDITHGSMASRTADAVYNTAVNSLTTLLNISNTSKEKIF